MKITYKLLAMLVVSGALASCGGGGSGDSAVGTKAAGAYQGSTSGGHQFQTLVLDDDEFWTIYGTETASAFYIEGFVQGQGVSDNGTYLAQDTKDFGVLPPDTGTLTATYVEGKQLNGTMASPLGSVTFSGTAIPVSDYDYSATPNIADITGIWSLTSLDLSMASLTISSSGSFAGSSGGCNFNGSIEPHSSGKNLFDFSLTFGTAPCVLSGQTVSGIGLTGLLSDGITRQLLIAGVDATRSNGLALFGSR